MGTGAQISLFQLHLSPGDLSQSHGFKYLSTSDLEFLSLTPTSPWNASLLVAIVYSDIQKTSNPRRPKPNEWSFPLKSEVPCRCFFHADAQDGSVGGRLDFTLFLISLIHPTGKPIDSTFKVHPRLSPSPTFPAITLLSPKFPAITLFSPRLLQWPVACSSLQDRLHRGVTSATSWRATHTEAPCLGLTALWMWP